MRLEEFFPARKKSRIEHLFDAGQVNLSIFDKGMVAVDEQCSERQDDKDD